MQFIKEEEFEGVDVDLNTALYEYGIIWKEMSSDNYLFYYGTITDNAGIYYKFDYSYMTKEEWIELLNESWVDIKRMESYADTTKKEMIESFPFNVDVMLNYYGCENTFGSSCDPFKIIIIDLERTNREIKEMGGSMDMINLAKEVRQSIENRNIALNICPAFILKLRDIGDQIADIRDLFCHVLFPELRREEDNCGECPCVEIDNNDIVINRLSEFINQMEEK